MLVLQPVHFWQTLGVWLAWLRPFEDPLYF
jgi:hypothetical protein